MADNVTLDAGAGGQTVRTLEDGSSIQWPVGVTAYATSVGTPDVLTIPLAAALADGASNPTTLLTGSCVLFWNTATWDRATGDTTNGLDVDVTRVIPGTSATHLGKAEDAAHTSGDVGVMALAVRRDSPSSTAGTDGDYLPLTTDSTGALYVNVQNTLTVGSHAVTNAGTFAVQATVAAGATNIAKAEDAASANADVGVPSMAVQKATPANVAGTDGDYEFLQMSAGRLWCSTTIDAALPAGTNGIGKLTANAGVTIGAVEIAAAQTLATVTTCSTVTTLTGGGIAHDGVDSGNPHKIGGRAVAHGANPTAVAAADRTDWLFNRAGVPFTIGGHPNTQVVSARIEDGDGAQTDTALVTVAGGLKIVVTRITVTADGSNTGPYDVRIGFGAANVPAHAHTGTAGIVQDFAGVPAGGGVTVGDGSGILAVGADGEDLRYTCEDPAGGNLTITVSYYTIES